jgi:hypothetical protein
MAFYKCPECDSFHTTKWPLFKGHLKSRHGKVYPEGTTAETFTQYEISEDEYNQISGKGPGDPQVETGLEKEDEDLDNPETPKAGTPKETPKSGSPENQPESGIREKIAYYTTDPVERLSQVMWVNRVEPKIRETITNVMALSPRYWANYKDLEDLLVSHLGPNKRGLCQTMVMQYADGVQIPREDRGMYPYSQGQNQYGPTYSGYPPPPYQPPPWAPAPAVDPKIAVLEAEVNHLREERQRDNEKRLLDRIAELEKKNEGGGRVAQLEAEVKKLTESLSGAGQTPTMTIYDGAGNPMVLPYDRGFTEALRRKQEVETESLRTEQMVKMMMLNGGKPDQFEPILAQMKADREASNKKIDELTKQMYDNQIAALKSEIKAAQDMAANSGGDGKGVLDVATEAGENLKEGAMAIAREVKESMDTGLTKIGEILTNRPPAPVTTVNRSPQDITAIIEEENALLGSLGEQ